MSHSRCRQPPASGGVGIGRVKPGGTDSVGVRSAGGAERFGLRVGGVRSRFVRRALDRRAAEAAVAVVQNHVLSRRRRALRLIETHLERRVAGAATVQA